MAKHGTDQEEYESWEDAGESGDDQTERGGEESAEHLQPDGASDDFLIDALFTVQNSSAS